MGNKQSGSISLPDMDLKMVLIGSAGSGKSSVFTRVTSNQFSYHYTQTTSVRIGSIVKKINVPIECSISLALWDLPGLEDMDMRRSYYKDIDGAIMVVNIKDMDCLAEVPLLKADLIDLTETKSELATFAEVTEANEKITEDDPSESNAESDKETRICEDVSSAEQRSLKLLEIPTLLLGNKVDELVIDENQEELHPNVVVLSDMSAEAKCTGWVPVSAKENDRSIDLAFTSFLRYLVEKKLNIEQIAGKIKGLDKIPTSKNLPTFQPPSTAATRLRERAKEEEDEYAKRLPLLQNEAVDVEYQIIRKLIGKVKRGHKDWNLAYRRFRKSTLEYNIAGSTSCSVEEIILNLKELIPENSLQVVEFQGWIKLELLEDEVDIDDVQDDVLEILDCFNYELVPNAAFVATTVKNAMMTIRECRTRLSSVQVPLSCRDQVVTNNKEISLLLSQCESCTSDVDELRKAIELAVMW